LSFEEGFALGIKVRKLEQILQSIDADTPKPVEQSAPCPQESADNLLKEKWCRISQG
jgi:hypothetical protein